MFLLLPSVSSLTNWWSGDSTFENNITAGGYADYYNLITKRNMVGEIYISGDHYTENSLMFAVDGNTNYTTIEKLVDDIWQPASFKTGPNSLFVGERMGIAACGHHLCTEDSDGHLHLLLYDAFDGNLSTGDSKILNAYSFLERFVAQPDNSSSWTGSSFNYTAVATLHTLIRKGYFQTDTTAATQPIRIRVWQGLNDSGVLILDQTHAASHFPASSETSVMYDGYLEFETGNNYFIMYNSDANFSLKTDASGLYPWSAADISLVREDHMLQIQPWDYNTNFTVGDWTIENNRIYISNTTGPQVGSFSDNSQFWNVLGSFKSLNLSAINYWTKLGNLLSWDNDVEIGGDLNITGKITTPTGIDLNINVGDALASVGGNFNVQAGDGGNLGGSINLTAGDGSGGFPSGDVNIKGGSSTPHQGHVTIAGGNPTAGDSHGGSVYITGSDVGSGSSQKIGGSVTITAGEGTGGSNGDGGDINLNVGNQGNIELTIVGNAGDGTDGKINLLSGVGAGGFRGGDISITTGNGSGNAVGGTLALKAGEAFGNSDGGSVTIDAGDSSGLGGFGDIILQSLGGDVGVGTSSPDSLIHIQDGSAGAVTAIIGTILTVEGSGDTVMSILKPGSDSAAIIFGEPSNNNIAGIEYDRTGVGGTPDGFQFFVGGGSETAMSIASNNYVGIGLADPNARLHVKDGTSGATAQANTAIIAESNTTAYLALLSSSGFSSGIVFGNELNNDGTGIYFNDALLENGLLFQVNDISDAIAVDSSGNVGIGKLSPNATLDVDGSIEATTIQAYGTNETIQFNNNGVLEGISGVIADGGNSINFQDTIRAYFGTGFDMAIYHDGTDNILESSVSGGTLTIKHTSVDGGDILIRNDATGAGIINRLGDAAGGTVFSVQDVNETNLFNVDSDGKVGIGTTSPNTGLHIWDATDISGSGGGALNIGASATNFMALDKNEIQVFISNIPDALFLSAEGGGVKVGSFVDGEFSVNNDHLIVKTNGNVGIGTIIPDIKLHIHDGSAGTVLSPAETRLTVESDANTYLTLLSHNGAARGIYFGQPESNIAGSFIYNRGDVINGFSWSTNAEGVKMVLDDDGQLGIGTDSPTQKLNVIGSGNFTGNLTVSGCTMWHNGTIFIEDC